MHTVGINTVTEERKNTTRVTYFPLIIPTIQKKLGVEGFEGDITHASEPRRHQEQVEEHLILAKCGHGQVAKTEKKATLEHLCAYSSAMHIARDPRKSRGILTLALWPLLA
jgi:hypothetical protein